MYIDFAKKIVCFPYIIFIRKLHIFRYVCLHIKQYMLNIFKHIFRHLRLNIFGVYFFYKNTIFVYMGHVCLYNEKYDGPQNGGVRNRRVVVGSVKSLDLGKSEQVNDNYRKEIK